MTSLFSKLALVDAKMAKLEDKLGVPQRRSLLLRKNTYNQITKESSTVDLLLDPKPYITTVKPSYINLTVAVEGSNAITVSINDLQVVIPRIYSPEALQGPLQAYIDVPEDYLTNPSSLKNRKWYTVTYVDDKDPVVWTLLLTKNLD